jgi:multiple sugar transport system permease protein
MTHAASLTAPRASANRLNAWTAYLTVGIGALVMLTPFYFLFVFATQSRQDLFSLPPPLFFGWPRTCRS